MGDLELSDEEDNDNEDNDAAVEEDNGTEEDDDDDDSEVDDDGDGNARISANRYSKADSDISAIFTASSAHNSYSFYTLDIFICFLALNLLPASNEREILAITFDIVDRSYRDNIHRRAAPTVDDLAN